MAKTTCLRCNKACDSYELDFKYECRSCQRIFLDKMKVKKGRGTTKKSPTFASDINSHLHLSILRTAVKVYKIKFRGKDKMVDYINDLHDTSLTTHVFSKLISPSNLKKYNLEWDYKKLDKYK